MDKLINSRDFLCLVRKVCRSKKQEGSQGLLNACDLSMVLMWQRWKGKTEQGLCFCVVEEEKRKERAGLFPPASNLGFTPA